MLRQRLHERKTVYCDLKSKCSTHCAATAFVGKPSRRLQELDVEKREPVLLRCSPLQRTHFTQMDTLQRTSEIYKILHEFHTAVTQSMFRLVPSLETDEWPVRYAFASVSGRSTSIQLHSSPVYLVHWHAISSSREVQIKRRSIARLSSESILPSMQTEIAERWHMNWEYVVYRISHGLHFAIMKNITDITPRHTAIYIRAQKDYARRFIRCNIASVHKKRILKASESYPIKMCTVDRGEPCHVRSINVPEYHKCMTTNYYPTPEHIDRCLSRSTLIKCDCCYDTIE
uniref:DBD_Tnp_Mut domain-containing protein n=1 Tax=Elaeophora elaphi TaxID=1147741 RepID=A0A0R3RHH1_9BILA